MAEIVLIRHGQTEWSANGRHTSYTDLALTAEGEAQARRAGERLGGRTFAAVISSPRRRALRTAELAGLTVTEVTEDLAEWNYGEYEGITTRQIRESRPDWSLWVHGCPGGESPEQVGERLDRVLARARAIDGDVALVGHGHSLRVTGARWVGLPAGAGGLLKLDTATVSVLGWEHAVDPVLASWNAPC
ncbi:phosphoglycerate mutase [Actinoplanes sp. SE50]|uniref:histidine phosphatase family protein n=1 Tax=unclassified Actinoplanes TaxID=2626549 RepID=UPI00023ED03C|nr:MULTISPECIES: histidine phosphatase family protein [unclassified Actinoplanes]AEV83834.1 phosphoglycerate mutase [Actinoplanes sp. SE50/110]ATO82022.1 phosphoglycerate mutase [Actinoplanes sp. SE50]SLL99430.1 phosphoglycerate mutase [Actinoplanes sp. SE50/110]